MSNSQKRNAMLYMPEQYDEKVLTFGHLPKTGHAVAPPQLLINNNVLMPVHFNVQSLPNANFVFHQSPPNFNHQQYHHGHTEATLGQQWPTAFFSQDLLSPAACHQQYLVPSAYHPSNTYLTLTSDQSPYGYGPVGNVAPQFIYDEYQQALSRESSLLSSPMTIHTEDVWSALASAHLSPTTTLSNLTALSCSPFVEQYDLSDGAQGPLTACMPAWTETTANFNVDYNIQSQASSPLSTAVSCLSQVSSPAQSISSTPSTTNLTPLAPRIEGPISASSTPIKRMPTSTPSPIPIKPTKVVKVHARNKHLTKTLVPKPVVKKPRATYTFKKAKTSGRSQEGPPKPWELEVFRLKEQGSLTYEQIQPIILQKFQEKKEISTLRGAYRKLKLPKHLRPRAAKWEPHHYTALFNAVRAWTVKKGANGTRVRWQRVAESIREGNFRPGANAVHKVYDKKREELVREMERQELNMPGLMQVNGLGNVVAKL